jgi:hypothetical protein
MQPELKWYQVDGELGAEQSLVKDPAVTCLGSNSCSIAQIVMIVS